MYVQHGRNSKIPFFVTGFCKPPVKTATLHTALSRGKFHMSQQSLTLLHIKFEGTLTSK